MIETGFVLLALGKVVKSDSAELTLLRPGGGVSPASGLADVGIGGSQEAVAQVLPLRCRGLVEEPGHGHGLLQSQAGNHWKYSSN